MRWGFKSRFHDLDKVMQFNPKMIEFHFTDEDVLHGVLNGKIYNCDYSIHLPEYWKRDLINPIDMDKLDKHLNIYKECITKGLSLQCNFNHEGKLKVIMHPGGMSIDKITDSSIIGQLYKNLALFVSSLEAEFKDVEILVENMPPLPWFFGGQYYSNIFVNPVEINEWCKKTSRKICLDISHLGLYCNYANRNIQDMICILQAYTEQIHLADAKGTDGEGAKIGEGNINFEAVIKEIKHLDIAVIPEVMWGHKQNYKAFTDIIERCNQWLI